jgi:hypothetical protein
MFQSYLLSENWYRKQNYVVLDCISANEIFGSKLNCG